MAPSMPWMLGLMFLILFVGGALVAVVAVARSAASRKPPGIPKAELASLGTTIRQADELAASGKTAEGLACLVAGMRQAQLPDRLRAPWGQELAARWQGVVEEYAQEHRIGPASEITPALAPEGRGDELAPRAE